MEKIEKAINNIGNIHPTLKDVIIKELSDKLDGLSVVKCTKCIREFLELTKSVNRHCEEYWVKRGWDRKPNSIKLIKNNTPYRLDFWIQKGMSVEEAQFKCNSMSPYKIEYWISKGNSPEHSELLMANYKKNSIENLKKGGLKRCDYRVTSVRCIEYWIDYHMGDIELAKKSLKEQQSTFSMQKCIEKHGHEKGMEIWNNRQIKWQNNLTNKPLDEIKRINESKGLTLQNFILSGKSVEEFETYLINRNLKIIKTSNQMICFLNEYFPYVYKYKPSKSIINDLPLYVTSFFSIDEKWILENYTIKECEIFKNSHGYYNMYSLNGKLLRSSLEIIFYNKLIEAGFLENLDFKIEHYYNIYEKCDFYMCKSEEHIEIYGGGYIDNYSEIIQSKVDRFDKVIVLKNVNEFENYIKGIKYEM